MRLREGQAVVPWLRVVGSRPRRRTYGYGTAVRRPRNGRAPFSLASRRSGRSAPRSPLSGRRQPARKGENAAAPGCRKKVRTDGAPGCRVRSGRGGFCGLRKEFGRCFGGRSGRTRCSAGERQRCSTIDDGRDRYPRLHPREQGPLLWIDGYSPLDRGPRGSRLGSSLADVAYGRTPVRADCHVLSRWWLLGASRRAHAPGIDRSVPPGGDRRLTPPGLYGLWADRAGGRWGSPGGARMGMVVVRSARRRWWIQPGRPFFPGTERRAGRLPGAAGART